MKALPNSRKRSFTDSVSVVRVIALLILTTLLASQSATVSASVGWCHSDPVVKIGDDVTDIRLSAPTDAPLKVKGPNEIVVTIPDSLSGSVVSVPAGFGKGESVTVIESPDLRATHGWIEVIIQVLVPAHDDKMPVHVEFSARVQGLLAPARAEGFANTWITLKTRF